MKKLFICFVISLFSLISNAQDLTGKPKNNNEFGIDATGFVKQFLNFNQSIGAFNYIPTYYLTYRRYLTPGNVRFAIGGDFVNQNIPPVLAKDSNKYNLNAYGFGARLGWEFYNDLSQRWQVFYGVDLNATYTYSKNDASYWSGNYAIGMEKKMEAYGLAPVLGFRFKLNNRLNLVTEANYSINYGITTLKNYSIPITNQFPRVEDE
jgi:hypothetical protein